MEKRKLVGAGIALGIILTMSFQVFAASAIEKIEAYANKEMNFEFDGKAVALPSEYEVIVYKDRSYVPARFVAENLGATVNWDNNTKKILFTKAQTSTPPSITLPAIETPSGNYKELPQTKDTLEYRLSVVSYYSEGQGVGDKLYLTLTNTSNYPIQLNQMATKIIADGVEYDMVPSEAADLDTKWYADIEADKTGEGYIRLPRSVKDVKNLEIKFFVNYNSSANEKEKPVTFQIDLSKER